MKAVYAWQIHIDYVATVAWFERERQRDLSNHNQYTKASNFQLQLTKALKIADYMQIARLKILLIPMDCKGFQLFNLN